MEKGLYIKELPENGAVKGIFCVAEKKLLQTKNGAPYLALTLTDNSGEIEARLWENATESAQLFDKGDFLLIHGESQRFRDAIQIKINQLEPVSEDQIDPTSFLPCYEGDIELLWAEFRKLSHYIKDTALRLLLQAMIKDPKFKQLLMTAPAAKKMHHAYLGGLLEHTVSVAKMALQVTKQYGHLDRNLLLAGSLLHDIGKIKELSYSKPPIGYSDEGRLIGHLVLGVQEVDSYVKRAGLEPNSDSLISLKHLILSHHGQREYGAPVLPMTEEAVVLHLIDDLDAKLNYLKGLKPALEGAKQQWTSYQPLMERYFLLTPEQDEGVISKSQKDSESTEESPPADQKKLWDLF